MLRAGLAAALSRPAVGRGESQVGVQGTLAPSSVTVPEVEQKGVAQIFL